jgi:hypothetical protein
MKRDATQTIWRTVVFAGAMLGAPACSKKNASTTPANTTAPAATETAPAADGSADPAAQTPAEPAADTSADPCMGGDDRPRGTDDDGGGGVGRGFVLS